MNSETKKEKNKVEINCQMSWEEFDGFRLQVIAKAIEKLKIPGFRPGKAPAGLAEDKLGRQDILLEAAELALQKVYPDILKEQKLEPTTQPKVEIMKLAQNNPFEFRVAFEIIGEIILPDYARIAKNIKKEEVAASEADLQETLNWILRSRAKLKPLERGVIAGDFIAIEYQSPRVENNKVFKDSFILGQGGMVAGFENNLVGLKAGEKKDFEVIFPLDFPKKELASKKVLFSVNVLSVEEMILPELNDEFAKTLGEFASVEQLKENIKKGIKQEKNLTVLNNWRKKVVTSIAQETQIAIPEGLIANDLANVKKENEGKEFDEQKAKQQIAQGLKELHCLREIGKQKNIAVSPGEIEQEINKFLTNYPQEKIKEIDLSKLKEYYKGMILNKKVFEYLETL